VELTHSFTVPASVEDTWATFMDLERVGGCFPGATVTELTDDGFAGTVKVKLGPIALQYAGSGTFVERDDVARRAVIEAKGKDKRGNGTAGATVRIQLADAGEGSTRADVVTELAVTGKPAQFGRGVMQDVSDKLLQQFIDCIEGSIGSVGSAAPAAEPVPAAGAAVTSAPEDEPSGVEATEAAVASGGAAPADTAAAAVASTPGPAPAAEPAPTPAATRHTSPPPADAIDLGSTVLPVLVRTYAKPVLAGVAAVVVIVVAWRALR
jgi:carbon monoxide dehydrogenase subunit G